MKNIIIENCVKAFKEDYNIFEKKEDVLFEHFSNYCVISKYCQDAYQEDPTSMKTFILVMVEIRVLMVF